MSPQTATAGRPPLLRLWPGCAQLEPQYAPRALPASTPVGRGPAPRISVVVPSFNQGRFLAATLDSLLAQDYPDLQILVVDGGSMDETREVIGRYAADIDWWVSEADRGQAHAINKGMARADGDVLAWLNSDDCLMPGALWRVAAAFRADPAPDVVYGHRVLIDDDGRDIGRWILPTHSESMLTYADYIPQETLFWRRELWERTGARVDESFRFALDWELIRRYVEAGARFELLPAFLGQFRVHAEQKSTAHIEQVGFAEMERIRAACRERFSRHRLLQALYGHGQRMRWWLYMARARLAELAWSARLRHID